MSPLQFMGFFYPEDMPVDLLDWSQISSLAWVPAQRPEVMCAAHAAGEPPEGAGPRRPKRRESAIPNTLRLGVEGAFKGSHQQ
mgnify:CR=1 FL=1